MSDRCLECNRGTQAMDIFGLCEVCSVLADGGAVDPKHLCIRVGCGKAKSAGVNYGSELCREHAAEVAAKLEDGKVDVLLAYAATIDR
jgi:hypothetical protein